MDFIKLQYSHQTIHVGNLYDSSRVIEGKFLESLERDEINGKNHWAVGPFNPVEIQSEISDSYHRHSCLQWLDRQPESSVIYVSFGTTTTFTEEQIGELAVGLENSRQRFLWVVRDADKGVALMMRDWGCRDELLTSVMVEKVIRKLMDSKEGEVIRRRAVELGGELRRSMAEGGVTRNELNSLVSYIRR
ncbi:hypothetical protein L6452_37159 [Arctium lappa]|uniref:Uncharacterized protein n=1 Tax=Arctium lappa TaxID=4217 RepID=A0ACB8Y2X6_ARCLA|nr:hypothetical protein L6452_37159 [Arctium lappa]